LEIDVKEILGRTRNRRIERQEGERGKINSKNGEVERRRERGGIEIAKW